MCQLQTLLRHETSAAGDGERIEKGWRVSSVGGMVEAGAGSLTNPIVCKMTTTSLKSYSPPSTLKPKLLIAFARISKRVTG